ncbi:MAG: PHP domain-containing protein [Spirochaetales bacterium]|nr:PHP domain-containing protein [Spirochaetales bacterium]
MLIDLHIHSSHSHDGEYPVSELVRMCSEKNIDAMAIADHNTAVGVSEALEAGIKYGVEIVPSIELDTSFLGRVFHLLGYYVDTDSDDFKKIKTDLYELEMKAFPEIIKNVQAMGIEVSWEDFLGTLEPDMAPTEELLANMIFRNPANSKHERVTPYLPGGVKSDMPQFNFYRDFLGPGREGFVPRDYTRLEEAVKMVRRNGGVPILAHPGGSIGGDFSKLEKLKATGIAGLEAFSSYHSEEENRRFLKYCKDNGLLYTCGSDFHGRMKPVISLGEHKSTEDQAEILSFLKAARG